MKLFSEQAVFHEKRRKVFNAIGWIFCALAILGVIAAIVLLIMLVSTETQQLLFSLLALGGLGLAAVGGLAAFGLFRCGNRQEALRRDCLEQADGEESFFVGEDTLVTFRDTSLKFHSTDEKRKNVVQIPYSEIRFFSVCIRRKARDGGDWCVVIEVPARYLSKGKVKKGEEPVMVQTEGKQRLYDCLKRHELTLLGEAWHESDRKKYVRRKKFNVPDTALRRKKLLMLALGLILAVIGTTICIAVRDWLVIGATLAAVGVCLAANGCFEAYRAKTSLVFYDEGIYWRQKTVIESTFLKWEEIESVSYRAEENVLRLRCAYGEYGFPAPRGAYEYLVNYFPEKLQ